MNKPLSIKIGSLQFKTFCGADNLWRWHCKAANGEKVCTSGESFHSQLNAERAMRDFIDSFRNGLTAKKAYADQSRIDCGSIAD